MNWTSTMARFAKRRATPLASALALTLMTGLTSSAAATSYNPIINFSATLPKLASTSTLLASPAEGPAWYTVVFKEAPLATYAGEVANLPAPGHIERNGVSSAKIDMESAAARAYVGYLETRQQAFVDELSGNLQRPLQVMARMQHALNAVIVRLSNAEASEVMKRADVMFIEREHELELATDRGPAFIGATSIWDGMTASGVATKGEGILIGDIDTGINWESPAFAAVGPVDGYIHQNPKGNGTYLGQCAPGGIDAGKCNDKLIGIYNFAAPGTTGTDTQGHGSHTASTVAGNTWNATFSSGAFTISGVAPHANVIAYLACPSTCPSTATAQAANQAVADGVDVINYSISGGTSPWTDATSTAFRNAVAAGTFVAASAGNTSTSVPNPQGQVNHMEPWVETVAASTEDRIIAVSLDLTSEASPPANTQDIPLRPGGAPLPTQNVVDVPLIKSPNFANGATDGCAAYPANTFVRSGAPSDRIFADGFDDTPLPPIATGAIAVLHLDGTASACGSGARRTAALNAGAVGVIFVDAVYLNLGASGTSWSMLMSNWLNLEAGSNPATATVSIDIAAQAFPSQGDVVADFSFRGPRLVSGQGMVKPDITGPGVDILAAGAASVVGPNGVYLSNGTSMSSPHMAGAAALMRALNPTWSATQVKSALNLSSNNFGAVNSDGSPVRLWDYGSGRVNLTAASKVGLIMDETAANFLAANPATAGDISTLNLASMAKANFVGDTTFTRTFRRARAGSQTYTLSAVGFPAGAIEFSPASFSINATGSRAITVTAHGALLSPAQWNLGELVLTPSAGDEPTLHLPIALNPAGPIIQVTPASVSGSSDTTVSNDLTIANIGNPTLTWSVTSTGTAQVTPLNTTTSGSGQLGGLYLGVSEGNYWSQNFDITGTTSVTTLRANGFMIPSGNLTTANTPSVTFSIYADNAGLPAGAPEGFGAAPVWTYTNTIGTAATTGITGTAGAAQLVLSAPGVPPLNLSSGRYWLTVFPSMNGSGAGTSANPLWAWRVSSDPQIGNPPVIYAPYDDPTQFQSDPATVNMSAFVQGTVSCVLPSWVSLNPTSGSLGFAGSQVVPVVFDAAGLSAGTYTATLCIGSNATNLPVVTVPLTFNVPNGGSQAPTLSKAFAPTSVETNVTSTLTITLNNAGPTASTLSADLTDTFPSGLVVATTPAAATTCPSGTVTAVAGSGSVSLSTGAQIPAAGSCTVTVDVTAATADAYSNTIAAGALQTSSGNNAAAANATLTVTVPPLPTCPIENFDGVTTPALPGGWTFTNVDGTGTWATVTTAADSAPNAAYTQNLGALGERLLVSPAFAPGAGSTVSFRNRYNMESGWDGGVLEISVNGGAYQDIIAAGGSFASGGYSGTISASSNPALAGRAAWTGSSVGAFVTSNAILPASAAGQPVRLRWRMAEDGSFSATAPNGWWVDTVTCGTAPPTVTKTFAPAVTEVGTPSTLTISLSHPASVATLTANLVDVFPANLVIAPTPNAATTCPAGSVTAVAGSGSVTLGTGAQIPTTGCTITVDVYSATTGYYTNTIPAGALQTDTGNSPAAATAIYRALAPTPTNYNTGFESPFTVGALGTQQGWGTTGTAANATISSALPANGTQHLRVTSTTGSSGTPVGAIAPTQPIGTGTHSVLSAKLRIVNTGAGATFEFNPQDPAAGVVSTLLRFDRAAARQIQVPNFTTGLYVPTGATWPLNTYFDISLAFNRSAKTVQICMNGTIIHESATAVSSPYIANAVVKQVGQSGNTAGNTVNVDDLVISSTDTPPVCAPPAPTVSKAFAPVGVEAGVPSTLTISLGNSAATAATLTAPLTDTFPAGMVVAATPNASTTCTAGVVTATAGSGSASLGSGAQIPPGGCTVKVDVSSATNQDYTNTISAGGLQTSNGNNASAASAILLVGNLVVSSAPLSIVVPADSNGVYFDFLAGTTSPTPTAGSAWNPYGSTNLTFFWPNSATLAPAGVSVTAGGNYSLLTSGDTVGPSSLYSSSGAATATANFRGVTGYLGIRFTNTTVTPNIVTYGYVHLQTTGATGHPATVLGYAYNRAGLPITIP
ncbi:MAG: S8 family serine peptidase [Xanthomonadales bacterium]|nr:S8 family serine peptidase [Xanthomonadales bacterium]